MAVPIVGSKKWAYVILSTVAAVYFVVRAAQDHHFQAFPTVVALAHSRIFAVIGTNFAGAVTWVAGGLIIRGFFGKLHDQETTRIADKLLGIALETMLTLTFFHSSLTPFAGVLGALLCFMKVLVQLCSGRQQLIEQNVVPAQRPSTPRLAVALFVLFFISVIGTNFFIMSNTADSNPQNQSVTIALLFACDSSILAIQCFAVTLKLLLNEVEHYQGRLWEAKGLFRFYVEIISEVSVAAIGIFFVIRVWMRVSAPYFLARQLFINVRNVFKGVSDLTQYVQLVKKIDRQIPNATPLQVEQSEDKVCNICYDDLSFAAGAAVVKRLPCGHLFHRQCLLRWFERNASCPYCRMDIANAVLPQAVAVAVVVPNAAAVGAQQPAAANNNNNNNNNNNGNAVAAAARDLRVQHQRNVLDALRRELDVEDAARRRAATRGDRRRGRHRHSPGSDDGIDDDHNNSNTNNEVSPYDLINGESNRLMYEVYRSMHAHRREQRVRDGIEASKARGFGEATAKAARQEASTHAATAAAQPSDATHQQQRAVATHGRPHAAAAEDTPPRPPAPMKPPVAVDRAVGDDDVHNDSPRPTAAVGTTTNATEPAAAPPAGSARESALLRRYAAAAAAASVGSAAVTPSVGVGAVAPPPSSLVTPEPSSRTLMTLPASATKPQPPSLTSSADREGAAAAEAIPVSPQQAELLALRQFARDLRSALDKLERASNPGTP